MEEAEENQKGKAEEEIKKEETTKNRRRTDDEETRHRTEERTMKKLGIRRPYATSSHLVTNVLLSFVFAGSCSKHLPSTSDRPSAINKTMQ
jgi:hypothetical protein